MTKQNMCETLISSEAWNGTSDVTVLMGYCKAEIEEMYNQIDEAEDNYYSNGQELVN